MTIEEYLATSFRPDCHFIAGKLVDRNVGEFSHGRIHGLLGARLLEWGEQAEVYALSAQRIHAGPDRVLVPDVCLIRREDRAPVIKAKPLLCVEILSSTDYFTPFFERLEDYIAMGVPVCWVIDPYRGRGFTFDRTGLHPVSDGMLRLDGTDLEVSLDELFADV